MDYNIKIKSEGMGKAAANTRQKVIQAQKSAEKKAGISVGGDKNTITAIKSLNSSITKLIASNKQLASAMGKGAAGGGAGRASGAGMAAAGGAGIGGVGASIPMVGAAIALTGFAVQKINQIGNAYISLAGQQKGSAGLGGFKTKGQGMYLAGEMGAGMKAYAQGTGKFLPPGAKAERGALDVGAIHGLSAQETLGQAGTFKRAGASYQGAAYQAAGAGIQTEIPTLLTGMAGIMEEAIKNGINTSDMSKDLGKELLTITEATGSKSVDAALNIVRSFKGTKTQVGEGKLGGMAGLYTAQAGRDMFMKKFSGDKRAEFLQSLSMDPEQRIKAMALGKDANWNDFQKAVGTTALGVEEEFTRKQSTAKMALGAVGAIQKQRGTSSEEMHRAATYNAEAFGGKENFKALWQAAKEGKTPEQYLKEKEEGRKSVKGMAKKVTGGRAGYAVKQEGLKQSLVFEYGEEFAKTSLQLNKSMVDIVKTLNGEEGTGVNTALKGVATTASTVAGGLGKLSDVLDNFSKKWAKIIEKQEKKINKLQGDLAIMEIY